MDKEGGDFAFEVIFEEFFVFGGAFEGDGDFGVFYLVVGEFLGVLGGEGEVSADEAVEEGFDLAGGGIPVDGGKDDKAVGVL